MSSGKLTRFDYTYLKGDKDDWTVKGAAWNVVSNWCQRRGYGTFGAPTDQGKKAMAEYEKLNL